MTREEAISALKNTAWIGTDKKVGEVEKAIMMAIEALKAQDVPDTNVGSNDLISRQEAIELIECMKPYQQDADDICEMLQNMPSAQPENQVHLCDSCRYIYPECPSEKGDVIFGNGKGNDNICACNKYEPSAQPEPLKITIDPPTADEMERLKQAMRITPVIVFPSAHPEPSEITDEQAIMHLQSTGWMQNHDREMYESGLRERLTDDSDSYDALLPSAQPEPPEPEELDFVQPHKKIGVRLEIGQPEPSDVARSIATIIENEQDMRVVLKNAQNDIVHCRDCKFCYKSPDWKYRQSFGESIWCCKENRVINFAQTVGLDDYCSSAKRKE